NRQLFELDEDGSTTVKNVSNINAYLVAAPSTLVSASPAPQNELTRMHFGNMPNDGGHLLLTSDEVQALQMTQSQKNLFLRRIYGSAEFIRGLTRYCLWISDDDLFEAEQIPAIKSRLNRVAEIRAKSPRAATVELA